MIAAVIPYARMIRGKETFDYRIPEGIAVQPGTLVSIEFRSVVIPGIVFQIKQNSAVKQLKPIIDLCSVQLWEAPERLALLNWFSAYYYISLPHAFKTMQYPVLKHPREVPLNVHKQKLQKSVPQNKTQSRIQAVAKGGLHLLEYNNRTDCLLFYRKLCSLFTGHLLIVVPEYTVIAEVQSVLQDIQVIAWASDPSPSELYLLTKLLQQSADQHVVIGTKKMIFLESSLFDCMVIDQEESRSHKQFHLNPRYSVPTVAKKIHEFSPHQLTTVLSSHSPTLQTTVETEKGIVKKIDIKRKWNENHITVVDMEEERMKENYSWFSETIIERIKQSKRSFLFLNRIGTFGISLCQDCAALLYKSTATCSDCGGVNIKRTRKGTEQLEKELNVLFADKKIVRIDRTQRSEDIQSEAIQQAEIVIGTELVFRDFHMNEFDFIGILSVDHLLVYPHFKAHERVYQLLTQIFIYNIPTVLQTHAPHHTVIRAAVQNDYESFSREELRIRKLLHLPPFNQYSVLINTTTKKTQVVHGEVNSEHLSKEVIVDRQE